MNDTLRHRSRKADAATLALTLAVIAAGFAVIRPAVGLPGPPPVASARTATHASAAPISAAPAGQVRVELVVGDRIATATLADIPAAHQLAAILPVTLDLHDPFGQAKSGPLPHTLDVAGASRIFTPATGGVYYWPDGGQLAVFYDALYQAVPPPGLVRLGSVDTGLDAIASRGDVTVTIQQAN